MSRRLALLAVLLGCIAPVGAAGAAAIPAPATGATLQVAPVTRVPFPERGFVVSVPKLRALEARNVVLRENGLRVEGLRVDPLASSGLRFGVVLALDSSESMTGAPAAAALNSARAFVAHREETEEVGIVAFNTAISVLQAPTRDERVLRTALAEAPEIAYGTHINDALMQSLKLLREARLSAGSIVLLSDGQEVGSVLPLDRVIAAAKEQRVRIFTVGLRSRAFDASTLREISARTGGYYTEARSAAELVPIYEQLSEELAGEYLVRYRSSARPMSQVDVEVRVPGVGKASTAYVAPTPSLLPPYHRSFVSTFLLSPGSALVVSLLFAGLICLLLFLLVRRPRTTVVERVRTFAREPRVPRRDPMLAELLRGPTRNQHARGWWKRLEQDLELARMSATPRQVVAISLGGASAVVLLALALSMPVLALFGLGVPFLARAVIHWKLRAVRNEFADQFPANLQVLASALRAGNSFNGALGVVVENAHEPARSELARVVQDDRLGVLPEDAIRKLARRMASRDVEQVALLAELHRTTGGNSAEILDTVVATIRDRADLRRLVMTLTAQGRMARWILTALPAAGAGIMWVLQPQVMVNFFTSSGGQVALVVAVGLVIAGSLVIQRIVDIEL
jgi:tight adherence protein B